MIRLANVLVASGNHSVSDPLVGRLVRNGYHVVVATSCAEAVRLANEEHPDLVLIGDIDGEAIALGGGLKMAPATADIPVLVMVHRVEPDQCNRAYNAGLDGVLAYDCDDAELFARLRPLVRLATMHAELHHRAAAAARFGVQVRDRVTAGESGRPTVLLVGEDADGLTAMLGAEAEIVTTTNLFEAEDLLTGRNFDAAVLSTDGASDTDSFLAFCSQVRNNPRLFNLPIILVSNASLVPADAFRRGASRVLHRPTDPVILRTAVLTLVRRQQLRWNIRPILFESLTAETREPLTGLYSRAFFEAYLETRLEIAKKQDRHLTVVFFYIPNIEGVRTHFGDDAAEHLTQQLGQWIGGLLRAEDLTALYQANQFCVALPDTPISEAEVVMHRIAGVLAYTDFAVRDVYQPIKVWVQVACTDAHSQDSLDSLLDRARCKLD
jgi:two-component system cell cycle response regulator